MTHVFTCDWCHEPIDQPRETFAQLSITGSYHDDGPSISAYRDFHAGRRGDETSCLARALRLLDGGADSGLLAGWDARTQLDELALPTRVLRVLRGAGVETVGQLSDERALGRLDGVRGIGARSLARIDEVLAEARRD